MTAIGDFLLKNDMAVSLVVFDKAAYALSEKLYFSIKAFIDDNYADAHFEAERAYRQRLDFSATTVLLSEEDMSISEAMPQIEDWPYI